MEKVVVDGWEYTRLGIEGHRASRSSLEPQAESRKLKRRTGLRSIAGRRSNVVPQPLEELCREVFVNVPLYRQCGMLWFGKMRYDAVCIVPKICEN